MRIAIITGEYHRRGGFPRHAADLAVGLVACGNDVTVYGMHGAVETTPEDVPIDFRTYPWVRRPLLAHMATHPRTVGRIAREIAPDFDAVVSIGIPCLAPVVLVGPGTHHGWFVRTTGLLPRLHPRRIVERLRPFHRIVLAWEKAMLDGRHPRLVVVPNRARAEDYTGPFGFPEERIAFVPNPVSLDEFRFDPELRARTRCELGVDGDTPLIVNVARRGRQKGLDVLAEALHRVEGPYRAVFAGDGSTGVAVQRATADLRADERVRLLGRVAEVRSLYCAADLLVFPSRWDPWGLVVTEALACGLPVLCSRDIGAAMAVLPGANGELLADPEDPDEIARGVEGLLQRLGSFDRAAVAATAEPFGRRAVAATFAEALAADPARV